MKSSATSPPSSATSAGEVLLVIALLSIIIAAFAWWTFHRGYLLYYGDAQAHLNNSRSIFDGRKPGYDQLGTVWLPMLHLLCLPFVRNSMLWSTGLAGTIPVACCFVIAGLFLFLTVRHVQGAALPAAAALLCFGLNPNILYLSVIPMTETVFLAEQAVLIYAGVRFSSDNRTVWLVVAVLAACFMCLTRYDGWFLLPFAASWFAYSSRHRRLRTLLLFTAVASLTPAAWMVHGWWETGNALDFFNGPYSAKAIQHGASYPGFHDWPNAVLYYAKAAQLCAGWGLVAVAALGLMISRTKEVLLPSLFLLLPCLFYVLSIHSSGNPIHVPQLWPFTYYNTRYGIAFVFFAAFAAGSCAQFVSWRHSSFVLLIPFLAVAPWALHPSHENWICWKESDYNSVARRAWTQAGAHFLRSNYRQGQGIVAPFGDVAGIFCQARIPLAQVLHQGDPVSWLATTKRPDLLHQQLWAVAQEGDILDRSLSGPLGRTYKVVKQIEVKDAPPLKIYKRQF